jgi:hypothetical protein
VIIYCLENSSFSQADGDGVITPIAKLADNKYHVVGEIIVAHEITMAAVANLKRILAVCGGRKVFIITPLLRYINEFCCGEQAHCTHRSIPDSATKLLLDLGRFHRFIESRLSSFPLCKVIPAGDLLAAKHGASTSKILAAYSSWGAVHGSGAAYTRMALTWLTRCCLATSKSPSLHRSWLTAVARGSALSLDPPPAAIGQLLARLTTLAAISCLSSPVAAVASEAAAAAGAASQLTSTRGATTPATTLAMSRATLAAPRGDHSGNSTSGCDGGYGSRYSSGSGGGGGSYSRHKPIPALSRLLLLYILCNIVKNIKNVF